VERVEEEWERSQKRRSKRFDAEFAESAEGAEKRDDVPANCDGRGWLPGSLRSVASAPQTAHKKKPATPVGMTVWVNCLGGFEEADQVGGGFGGFFDLGDAAGGVVGGVELIEEDVGIGVDDAEEIVDGVGDGIHFGDGATVNGWLFERI